MQAEAMKYLTTFLLLSLAIFSGCGTELLPDGSNNDPIASFTIDPPSVPRGDNYETVVTLDASESSDEDGDPLTFQWTVQSAYFVEGTASTSEIAKVTFPGIADYSVTLEVSDGNGGSNTLAGSVLVE